VIKKKNIASTAVYMCANDAKNKEGLE